MLGSLASVKTWASTLGGARKHERVFNRIPLTVGLKTEHEGPRTETKKIIKELMPYFGLAIMVDWTK